MCVARGSSCLQTMRIESSWRTIGAVRSYTTAWWSWVALASRGSGGEGLCGASSGDVGLGGGEGEKRVGPLVSARLSAVVRACPRAERKRGSSSKGSVCSLGVGWLGGEPGGEGGQRGGLGEGGG